MEENIIYIGIGILALGLVLAIKDLLLFKFAQTEIGFITRVKNKTRKSSRYCYPYATVISQSGVEKQVICYSAKKRGHDRYSEGEEIKFLVYTLLGKVKFRCQIGLYKRSTWVISVGIVTLAYALYQK